MPKPFPKEFRDDVVRVARNREPGQTIKQIATDFGIAESCLGNWLLQADVEDGVKPGTTTAENAELREAKKRIRLLEQENEVLRRAAAYLSQANLPGKRCTRSYASSLPTGFPGGDVPDAEDRSPALLPLAGQPGHRRRARAGVLGERVVRCSPRRSQVRLPLPGR